jgi:hypothetical protein
MRPDESDQDIHNCIFEGFLEKEAGVYVTVTGGCPFSNSFEVSIFLIKIFFLKTLEESEKGQMN